MTTSPSQILIVAPAWVGDAVISQPLLRLLHRRHRTVALDVLAPPWVAPVYQRMAEVRAVIPAPFPHGKLALRERQAVARALQLRRHDQAILLPNSLKSALVPWLAGIPLRTGYTGEQRYGLLNDRRTLRTPQTPRLVDRFAALAVADGEDIPGPLPDPQLRIDVANQGAARGSLGLSVSIHERVVALCPGAEYGPAKRWPVAHYAEVANTLLAQGRQVWIFGSRNDADIGAGIVALAPGAIDLCGRTSLVDAIDLLAATELVITNDSGLMHIAAAVGCRVVALFGSSTPLYTPPLSPRATTISLKLECSPCFERVCPLGHTNCLNQLAPRQILDAIADPGARSS